MTAEIDRWMDAAQRATAAMNAADDWDSVLDAYGLDAKTLLALEETLDERGSDIQFSLAVLMGVVYDRLYGPART